MTLRHSLATLAFVLSQWQSIAAQAPPANMLEIRANTPTWVNGCLDLTVERVNVSTQSDYLPDWEGVTFWVSTKMMHHDPTRKAEEFWLVFYGLSDNVSYDAHQLAAGSKTTDHFCLPETFALVSKAEKTRRQIVVRGRVRIAANYFPTEEHWRTNKAELEKHMPILWRSPSASLEIPLPCLPRSECVDCKAAPLITEGERVVIPDVFRFDEDWNERGQALADSLYQQHPACKN